MSDPLEELRRLKARLRDLEQLADAQRRPGRRRTMEESIERRMAAQERERTADPTRREVNEGLRALDVQPGPAGPPTCPNCGQPLNVHVEHGGSSR